MIQLGELFEVSYGHSLELNRLTPRSRNDGGVAFVSRKMGNNGIASYVAPVNGITPAPAGELTCALSGSVLYTFLQDQPFYTGFHVARLKPLVPMTKEQLLYYCACITSNRYRFSYGRQANRTLKSILIPTIDEIPIWVKTADIHKYDDAKNAVVSATPPLLCTVEWGCFEYQDLFEIKKGKRLTKSNMDEGGTAFIGSTDNNNGITNYVQNKPAHYGNVITVNYNGSVGESFYQPAPFFASDDVNILYPKFCLNPFIALFLCTVIRQEKYRFNYGRKWHKGRMETSKIKLPVDKEGRPDWQFMERYIKTLRYSVSL